MKAHFKVKYGRKDRRKENRETGVRFECAACRAADSAPLDPVEGVQEWTIDCGKCCQPVTVRIDKKSGEVLGMECRM